MRTGEAAEILMKRRAWELSEQELDLLIERHLQQIELHEGRLPDRLREEIKVTAKEYIKSEKPKEQND